MDPGYITILVLVAVGVLYGRHKKVQAPLKKSNSGWKGLGVLAVLIAGLVIASSVGSETLTWMFGLSLMIAIPLMLVFAIGSAIGAHFRKDGNEEQ